MKTCQHTATPNHSSDLLEVFHGKTEPTIVCGYHFHNWGLPNPELEG